jgi:hypothetical protein
MLPHAKKSMMMKSKMDAGEDMLVGGAGQTYLALETALCIYVCTRSGSSCAGVAMTIQSVLDGMQLIK